MKNLLIIIVILIKFLAAVFGLGIIFTVIGNLYSLPVPSVFDCMLIAIGIFLIIFKINPKL